MNTLTKLAMGLMGRLEPRPVQAVPDQVMALPAAGIDGGLPLMQALARRQSQRLFSPTRLEPQLLGDLLWAAAGINRGKLGGRTAPSAMNAQEVVLYAALPDGLYRYEPEPHQLRLVAAADVRRVTGYQDFVDDAGLDLIYVADHSRMSLVPAAQRVAYAHVAAGAMAQNVYLYSASQGLSTVLRAWLDRDALSAAMDLGQDQQILLAQTVGHPAP